MRFSLESRTALVTGATAGIGRAVAVELGAAGATIVAVARRTGLLADTIKAAGAGSHTAIAADLATAEAPSRLLSELTGLPPIDIFVHCAGRSINAPLGSGDDVWTTAFNLMFHTPRQITEALIPSMAERGYGRIVLLGGSFEPGGVPNASGAAKAAMRIWAKAAANATAKSGITINTINPGRINTEQILNELHPDPGGREAFAKANIPAGYFGDPEDVAYLTAYLASPMARYVTGAVIPVDGGMRRWAF
jgi:3-oxoacyl-[acyl-carrier protein] reductase